MCVTLAIILTVTDTQTQCKQDKNSRSLQKNKGATVKKQDMKSCQFISKEKICISAIVICIASICHSLPRLILFQASENLLFSIKITTYMYMFYSIAIREIDLFVIIIKPFLIMF